ncbi:MAG: mechanosensitive ion channel [Phycisphaerales bacterium]
MQDWLASLESSGPWVSHTVATLVLVLCIVLARGMLSRWVRRSTKASPDMQRRWLIQIRNILLLALVIGLLVIWGAQLRTVALSAVAIAAALVIATKELIMCVSGTILEGSGRGFSIGDRIEVAGIRGDVFDQTLLTTTVLEVGPGHQTHQYTGRTVTLPNSLFLTSPIINETATDEYVLHLIVVPLKADEDLPRLERALLEAAVAESSSYLDDAKKNMERIGSTRGLKSLSVEPRVTVQLVEPGRANLVLRLPAPARRRGQIEQAILRAVLPELTRPVAQEGAD